MATKDELENRESACSDTESFVTLARAALADPADPEYARHLLQQAELKAQFPKEYVAVAEVYAEDLQDTDYARDLYTQAEEACFEGNEFAVVGTSLACTLGDTNTARTLLNRAAEEITDPEAVLSLATQAQTVDPDLAQSLLAQVEESCVDLGGFRTLAQCIAATDREAARNTYKKAERLCGDIGAMVDYARGAKSVFGDDEWVAEILGGVEVDCQFPKEFVALAGGYRELLGRDDKVDELLESGAEFAMSGEEYVDLAKGYWELKNDAEQATSFFEKALDEVGDRGQLLDLASMLINELDAKAVAKKFYAKASEKTTVAGDFVKLAQTVAAELVDRDYAAEVYQQAEAKVTGAHDLINLANAITTDLEDTAWATKLFQKALVQTDDFPGLNKLLDAVTASNTSVDEALARPLLDKLAATAQTTRELIAARDRAMDVLGDQQAGARMLELAEDRVTSLEEMRSLAQAVEQHSPEDNEWNTRVAEKLAKREANQEKYAVIQKRESGCTSSRQLIGLAEEVNRELDDKFYARKLLMAAADVLANETFDFSKLRLLIIAVDATLGDSNWLSELYDKAASHCSDFACVAQVARSAVSDVSDTALGESLCRKILRQYESSCSNWTFYQAAKFAGAIDRNTGDQEWARKLLNRAETLGGDHLDLAYLGNLAQRLGDQQRAQSLFDRAAGHCQRASDAAQLGFRLQRYGLPADKIRNLYLSTKDRMATGLEKLHWAEGILDVFGDETWARDVYEGLSAEFTDPRERTVYLASRQHRLERRV